MYLRELEKIRLHLILQQIYLQGRKFARITQNPLILQYPNANCTEFTFPDLI